MKIFVDTKQQILRMDKCEYACAIGKNGAVPECNGREGDGKTPLGTYKLRYGMYRADRIELPDTYLPFWALRKDDGWCDTSGDPAYNRPVRLPYPSSAEHLWRDSPVYDIIIVLGHNDDPPAPNMGSAIFLHIAREGYAPTQGCVAVSREDMLALVSKVDNESSIEIQSGYGLAIR